MTSEGTTPGAPPGPTRPGRARRRAAAVGRYYRGAPGTCLYLLILGANTFALVQMSPRFRKYFLFSHSTNLIELRHHPVKALISSAFWTETPSFAFWFLLFSLFHVPVERWLGTLRWLAVVPIAHVLATLVSEGAVSVLISMGKLPHSTTHTIDIGVSYGLSGSVGVLTWFFARPLRWWYLGAATVFFVLLFVVEWDFTNLGHLTAFLLGVACYPITRGVPGGDRRPPWRPSWPPRLRSHGRADADNPSPLRSGATG
ncbi:rhomboid-like protein [Streptacidiphilus carbonis]|uniref:rhomboid-like protein n=1 Tax=Streptacidiphilus carbonis TaxID=105422 RepID=UPI000AA485EE|nr:rhomboid-like protein [Streptacidiphilus carbonis]